MEKGRLFFGLVVVVFLVGVSFVFAEEFSLDNFEDDRFPEGSTLEERNAIREAEYQEIVRQVEEELERNPPEGVVRMRELAEYGDMIDGYYDGNLSAEEGARFVELNKKLGFPELESWSDEHSLEDIVEFDVDSFVEEERAKFNLDEFEESKDEGGFWSGVFGWFGGGNDDEGEIVVEEFENESQYFVVEVIGRDISSVGDVEYYDIYIDDVKTDIYLSSSFGSYDSEIKEWELLGYRIMEKKFFFDKEIGEMWFNSVENTGNLPKGYVFSGVSDAKGDLIEGFAISSLGDYRGTEGLEGNYYHEDDTSKWEKYWILQEEAEKRHEDALANEGADW